jgi:hypothetical protein
MKKSPVWLNLILLLALSGCLTHQPLSVDDLEQARGDAVQARYRALQEDHKPAPLPKFECLLIARPEHAEDGITYVPFTDFVRIPRTP